MNPLTQSLIGSSTCYHLLSRWPCLRYVHPSFLHKHGQRRRHKRKKSKNGGWKEERGTQDKRSLGERRSQMQFGTLCESQTQCGKKYTRKRGNAQKMIEEDFGDWTKTYCVIIITDALTDESRVWISQQKAVVLLVAIVGKTTLSRSWQPPHTDIKRWVFSFQWIQNTSINTSLCADSAHTDTEFQFKSPFLFIVIIWTSSWTLQI